MTLKHTKEINKIVKQFEKDLDKAKQLEHDVIESICNCSNERHILIQQQINFHKNCVSSFKESITNLYERIEIAEQL